MIEAFLYDAKGEDRAIPLPGPALPSLKEHQLLWIDVVGGEKNELEKLRRLLELSPELMSDLQDPEQRPSLHNYGDYAHCEVIAIAERAARDGTDVKSPTMISLHLIIGPNWIVTIAKSELTFLDDFRDQDRGETLTGGLSSLSLAASLLDWHLATFLAQLEELESFVDQLDDRLLARRSIDSALLGQVVRARRFTASLRRNLVPQRTVFYGLSRPDFMVAENEAADHFKALERHFERVIDAIEHGRELVQGSFELFTTRVGETTNVLIRRLTFLSLMLGGVGAVAGIFGMNFQTPYTATGLFGFWLTLGGLALLVVAAGILSRLRGWI